MNACHLSDCTCFSFGSLQPKLTGLKLLKNLLSPQSSFSDSNDSLGKNGETPDMVSRMKGTNSADTCTKASLLSWWTWALSVMNTTTALFIRDVKSSFSCPTCSRADSRTPSTETRFQRHYPHTLPDRQRWRPPPQNETNYTKIPIPQPIQREYGKLRFTWSWI